MEIKQLFMQTCTLHDAISQNRAARMDRQSWNRRCTYLIRNRTLCSGCVPCSLLHCSPYSLLEPSETTCHRSEHHSCNLIRIQHYKHMTNNNSRTFTMFDASETRSPKVLLGNFLKFCWSRKT